jgi:hypothetical protein
MSYQLRNASRTIRFTIAFAFAIASPSWGLNSYYAFDGSSLRLVQGDPSEAHVNQWAAFYFKKGASTSEISQRWGMDLQDSPEAVVRNVESNQKFEKRYEKWCACTWGSDTFFNVAAPVAMLKEASSFNPKQLEIIAKAHEGWDRLQGLISRFNTAAGLAGEQKLPKLGGTGPFADFMNAMHSAVDQALSISSQVTRYSDVALGAFEFQLEKFSQTTELAAVRVEPAVKTLEPARIDQASVKSYRYLVTQGLYATQSFSVGGNEFITEVHFEENGSSIDQWTRDAFPIVQMTIYPPTHNTDPRLPNPGVWCVLIECPNGTSCGKLLAADDYHASEPEYMKQDLLRRALVAFRTEEEATGLYESLISLGAHPKASASPATRAPDVGSSSSASEMAAGGRNNDRPTGGTGAIRSAIPAAPSERGSNQLAGTNGRLDSERDQQIRYRRSVADPLNGHIRALSSLLGEGSGAGTSAQIITSVVNKLLDGAARATTSRGSIISVNCTSGAFEPDGPLDSLVSFDDHCGVRVEKDATGKSKIDVRVVVGNTIINSSLEIPGGSTTVNPDAQGNVMVGHVDVSQFAGLRYHDSVGQASEIFGGQPKMWPEVAPGIVTFKTVSVEHDSANKITGIHALALDADYLRSRGISDPLVSLLGQRWVAAVESLGPPARTIGNDMIWTFAKAGLNGYLAVSRGSLGLAAAPDARAELAAIAAIGIHWNCADLDEVAGFCKDLGNPVR